MRLQLRGCHQELERYVSKVLNSGDVKAGIIGRPANSVAIHSHLEFFYYGGTASTSQENAIRNCKAILIVFSSMSISRRQP